MAELPTIPSIILLLFGKMSTERGLWPIGTCFKIRYLKNHTSNAVPFLEWWPGSKFRNTIQKFSGLTVTVTVFACYTLSDWYTFRNSEELLIFQKNYKPQNRSRANLRMRRSPTTHPHTHTHTVINMRLLQFKHSPNIKHLPSTLHSLWCLS